MTTTDASDETRPWLRDGGTNEVTLAVRPYSCRHLLLVVCGGLLACLALPYLVLGGDHPDSCYIVRAPHRIHAEEVQAEQRILNATGGLEVPALEAVESSPEQGRVRKPSLYYQHQTAIMIALLAACLAIKLAYALRHMRPPPATATVRQQQEDQLEMGNLLSTGNSSARRSKSGSKPSSKTNTPTRTPPSADVNQSSASPFHFHWWEIFRLIFGYCWYLAAFFLCNALKSILADTSCSTHGNSVSGHYLFFCFALWTIGYTHLVQKHLHGESMLRVAFWRRLVNPRHLHGLDYAFLVSYSLFVGVSVSILCDTYFYGFHSLRQIIYGFAMAVLVFLGVTGVFESVEERLSKLRGYAHVKGQQASDLVRNAQNPRTTNPALATAYLPFVSGLLHEWFYTDERAQRFYTFPIVALLSFQLVAWLVLACSPTPGYFRWPDVAAVVVGFFALLWISHAKLRPATRW